MAYWYVATEYTKYPGGTDEAYLLAVREVARLTRAGVPAYSPIAHNHKFQRFDDHFRRLDHDGWMKVDHPMMKSAHGLIVITTPAVYTSLGVVAEIGYFARLARPIVYVQPAPDKLPLHRLATLGPALRCPEAARTPLSADTASRIPSVPLTGN